VPYGLGATGWKVEVENSSGQIQKQIAAVSQFLEFICTGPESHRLMSRFEGQADYHEWLRNTIR